MQAYISKENINVMCLYLELKPVFKKFCESRTCDQCILAKYFSDDTDENEHLVSINEGNVLFLADEKEIIKKVPHHKGS